MLTVLLTTQKEAQRLYETLWNQGYRVTLRPLPDSDGNPLWAVSAPAGAKAHLYAA
jgi:hypothetical protein